MLEISKPKYRYKKHAPEANTCGKITLSNGLPHERAGTYKPTVIVPNNRLRAKTFCSAESLKGFKPNLAHGIWEP